MHIVVQTSLSQLAILPWFFNKKIGKINLLRNKLVLIMLIIYNIHVFLNGGIKSFGVKLIIKELF